MAERIECTECKRFVWCEWPKLVYHKQCGVPCEDFEPRTVKHCDGKPSE